MSNIKEHERVDDLNRKGYRIIQDPTAFCFGMDAVLLSGFAKSKPNEKVVDLCTGTGVIPILMCARYEETAHFTGLEIQKASADMASRSVELNGLTDKIDIVNGDICEAGKTLGLSAYDVVTCNPPYMNENHGLKNPDSVLAIARHEILCTLDDVAREAARLLKVNGRFYMVHRPHRLVEIFEALRKYKLEPKRMRMVFPYVEKEANMVLIEAIKGARPMLKVMPPLVIYKEPGQYTQEVIDLYEE